MTKNRQMQIFAWSLGLVTLGLALAVWAQVRLKGVPLTTYDIFPLLGLTAFGLMWTHYVVGAIRQKMKMSRSILKSYFKMTSWIVLVLILLHPGLFFTQLWFDGLGLPPASYLQVYTDTAMRIALLLGTLSLLAFLSFELHRKFKKASWWPLVEYANIVSMCAISYHALTLGGELSVGWFRLVWLGYLLTFIASVAYTEVQKRQTRKGIEP